MQNHEAGKVQNRIQVQQEAGRRSNWQDGETETGSGNQVIMESKGMRHMATSTIWQGISGKGPDKH